MAYVTTCAAVNREIDAMQGQTAKIKELETDLEALFKDFEQRGKTIEEYDEALTAAEKKQQ